MSFAKLWSKTPVLMDFTDNSNVVANNHGFSALILELSIKSYGVFKEFLPNLS